MTVEQAKRANFLYVDKNIANKIRLFFSLSVRLSTELLKHRDSMNDWRGTLRDLSVLSK